MLTTPRTSQDSRAAGLELMTRAGRGTSRLTRRALSAIVALITLVGACGRDDAAGSDSAGTARTATTTGAATGAGAPQVRRAQPARRTRSAHARGTGRSAWRATGSRRRGSFPSIPSSRSSLRSVPAPTVYRVNKAGLALYLFEDSLARIRAARTLDTTRFVSAERPLTVLTEATLIQNDNLLALFFGKNEHQRERVSDALTRGTAATLSNGAQRVHSMIIYSDGRR